jgi:hypothetical protein
MTGPSGKPWVILTDFRKAHNIQTHRQGEFDRSAFLGEDFGPLLPGNQVWVCPLPSRLDPYCFRRTTIALDA